MLQPVAVLWPSLCRKGLHRAGGWVENHQLDCPSSTVLRRAAVPESLLIHAVDGYLRPGDVIGIRLGDRRFGGPGTRVQTFVEDEFEIHLFVDALGTSRMAHADVSPTATSPCPSPISSAPVSSMVAPRSSSSPVVWIANRTCARSPRASTIPMSDP